MLCGDGSESQLYARSFTDVYDDWYRDLDNPNELVDAIANACARNAHVLELGSGTGRLSGPLHDAGFVVLGLDAALSMLRQSSPGPISFASDMTHIATRSRCVDVVLVAYNTFFNLASRDQQRQCLSEVARVLRPGGTFVVEAFVAPPDAGQGFGVTFKDHPTDSSRRLAILSGPDAADPETIVGSHIELGQNTTCRPWQLRYQSPPELDASARNAGLELRERNRDWAGNQFEADDSRHVSWYERI